MNQDNESFHLMIYPDGAKEWRFEGKLHRVGGPAYEEASGYCEYWQNGDLHREDGPAVMSPNGARFWYRNNQLHREDGPAAIYFNGYREWWLDGKKLKHIKCIKGKPYG